MIDQSNLNQPNEFVNTTPVSTPSVSTPPEPINVQPPASPTVILPSNNGSVPKWFYFIFGITLIVFFLVTTFLVMQLTQKQQTLNIETVPTTIPRVTQSAVISPVLSPVASNAAVMNLDTLDSSDEIASIENDLKNTDLTDLDKGIEASDREMDNSSL